MYGQNVSVIPKSMYSLFIPLHSVSEVALNDSVVLPAGQSIQYVFPGSPW